MNALELPGMDQIERVELPFAQRQPVYRVQWRFLVTGRATFTTWDDPEEFTEDEGNAEILQDAILDGPDSDVEYDSSWYQVLEVQQEDGTWKALDAETYDRIQAHDERAAR